MLNLCMQAHFGISPWFPYASRGVDPFCRLMTKPLRPRQRGTGRIDGIDRIDRIEIHATLNP